MQKATSQGNDVKTGIGTRCSILYHARAMALLHTLELVTGALLSLAILLQHRASGLSATFGGGGTTYVQRRGAEKMLFRLTIWLSVAFFAIAVAILYFGK